MPQFSVYSAMGLLTIAFGHQPLTKPKYNFNVSSIYSNAELY